MPLRNVREYMLVLALCLVVIFCQLISLYGLHPLLNSYRTVHSPAMQSVIVIQQFHLSAVTRWYYAKTT